MSMTYLLVHFSAYNSSKQNCRREIWALACKTILMRGKKWEFAHIDEMNSIFQPQPPSWGPIFCAKGLLFLLPLLSPGQPLFETPGSENGETVAVSPFHSL
jgi:hypothetical protein